MKINRHNYEEYFILYLDNELNEADRRMVESFIILHPDLNEELELLQQFKLQPDTSIIFNGKEELMINGLESQQVNENQESLLNYIDGELGVSEKINLENLVAANPALRTELEIFQKTKLEPELIIFPDKSSLYRNEPAYRVGTRWWRIAAAAVLLIGLGFTTLVIINNNKKPGGEMVNTGDKKTTSPVITRDAPLNNEQIASEENAPVKEEEVTTPLALSNNTPEKKPSGITLKKEQVIVPEKQPGAIASNETNNLPEPIENPYLNNRKAIADVAKENNTASFENEPLTKPDVTSATSQPYIVQASYPGDDAMEQPDSKKNKLRGFFRKVTRTFEKRTNIEATDNENKLLVAGLAIKLK